MEVHLPQALFLPKCYGPGPDVWHHSAGCSGQVSAFRQDVTGPATLACSSSRPQPVPHPSRAVAAPEGPAAQRVAGVVQGGAPEGVGQRRLQVVPQQPPHRVGRLVAGIEQVPPGQVVREPVRAVRAASAAPVGPAGQVCCSLPQMPWEVMT